MLLLEQNNDKTYTQANIELSNLITVEVIRGVIVLCNIQLSPPCISFAAWLIPAEPQWAQWVLPYTTVSPMRAPLAARGDVGRMGRGSIAESQLTVQLWALRSYHHMTHSITTLRYYWSLLATRSQSRMKDNVTSPRVRSTQSAGTLSFSMTCVCKYEKRKARRQIKLMMFDYIWPRSGKIKIWKISALASCRPDPSLRMDGLLFWRFL